MSIPLLSESWHDALTQQQAIAGWLNCYLREFALPRGEADLDDHGLDAPAALLQQGGRRLRLRFDKAAGQQLCIGLGEVSALGRCTYRGAPYLKQPGHGWRAVDAQELARYLLERLAAEGEFNHELLAQSAQSLAVSRALLPLALASVPSGDPLLDAEQSMLWGHALHPTPKSREGVALESILAASPEARTQIPLYWFRIDPRLLRQLGRNVRPSLRQAAGQPPPAAGQLTYPCHPWEVPRLLAHPLLQQARAQGLIEPLGERGLALYPTSSVRTLYHPDLNYFYKLSIHVRLTNCVRKNAWYELESAVALSTLLAPAWQDLQQRLPGFKVLLEPAATTLDFCSISDDITACRELVESFGMLYRENIKPEWRSRYRPQVAGALFAFDASGHSHIRQQLDVKAAPTRYADRAGRWFAAYAGLLLEGVWLAFFKHGVVLEPHLQNTVIGFEDGLPAKLWVRDLEGTKLIAAQWPAERLAQLPERVRASLHYSREQGWRRIVYCALVNNLAEAIFHLAAGDTLLEARLWAQLSRCAHNWQAEYGAQPELSALLAGAPLIAKHNLRTRLFKRADRDADYGELPNPMSTLSASKAA